MTSQKFDLMRDVIYECSQTYYFHRPSLLVYDVNLLTPRYTTFLCQPQGVVQEISCKSKPPNVLYRGVWNSEHVRNLNGRGGFCLPMVFCFLNGRQLSGPLENQSLGQPGPFYIQCVRYSDVRVQAPTVSRSFQFCIQ